MSRQLVESQENFGIRTGTFQIHPKRFNLMGFTVAPTTAVLVIDRQDATVHASGTSAATVADSPLSLNACPALT
ncbi:hypothetical protein [Cryobacterium fucosi]|uniref:Uncharacterized protein n=1 Tax=Cryobacterium fucosi TaxID=1259157 RepID=A0A4R9B7H7_9MICO|nr:hypothetical protein [Cryobacterium fucosi]TFD76048.1 hypothetical protein E3T48_10765 [Cryobacterium fucosi]